jgi:methylthioribose-1-phosphate isomerase
MTLSSADDAARVIKNMNTRGAPLIGVVGAYGLALAVREDASDDAIQEVVEMLAETRPTAINLKWALWRMRGALLNQPHDARAKLAWEEAAAIADEDEAMSKAIGQNGLKIIRELADRKPGKPLNILTHCNAGWLATVDYGTALAPIYLAHDEGIKLHVWVDETRPRNQGASLTAFELGSHGVPHTILADNAGGHYMQAGEVDMVIVGTDRVTANGDVANKIGTYLKALAAKDNGVPFYVALPSSTIDWTLESGRDIPIEERSEDEVLKMAGRLPDGSVTVVEIAAPGSGAANPGFDVTPARLVTGLITERGTCAATPEGLRSLFPETQE